MSNVTTKKVFIKIESASEQQENLKNTRKTLKILQSGATDKENLAGRPLIDKISRLKAVTELTTSATDNAKRKKIDTKCTQTSAEDKGVTAGDLTDAEVPGSSYFQLLAEKRREALEATLLENQYLHERIEGLETELNTSRQMLEETKSLVEVLTEMLNENEAENEIEQGREHNSGSDTESKVV